MNICLLWVLCFVR